MAERQVVKLTRAEAAALLRAGAAAAKAGKSALACPYDPNGDATERVKVAAWMRGYATSRR